MKKFLALLLAAVCCLSFVGCDFAVSDLVDIEGLEDLLEMIQGQEERDYLSYEEYMAAELDTEVVIEAYVQATQSWWDDKITVYLQDEDGGYFVYEMTCSEEDAEKLTPGTRIRVTGTKIEWSGEVEIASGATFTFVEGADKYVADPVDLTSILADEDELIKHQNEFAIFKGLTIDSITYKNNEPGDDIYVDVKLGDEKFSFCVERYLTGPETDVYKAFADLEAGDTVDITGFVYWYAGVNTHITEVVKK